MVGRRRPTHAWCHCLSVCLGVYYGQVIDSVLLKHVLPGHASTKQYIEVKCFSPRPTAYHCPVLCPQGL